MRRILMVGLLILFAVGAPAVAHAQPANPPGLAQVEAIIATHPNGGPGLQQAIAAAVEAQPGWAAAVVVAARSANVLQQQALGLGLAEAVAWLRRRGSPSDLAAADEIVQAAASAPPAMLATFTIASSTTVAPIANGLTGSSNLVTNNCVSPSAPGHRCSP